MPDDPDPPLDVPALLQRVEQVLLGGPRELTRLDVVARSGLPAERIRELWRSLGFATVADDERVFTQDDLDALATVRRLVDIAPLDDDALRSMTRMLGRTFSRLASWQGQLVVEVITGSPELLHSEDDIVDFLQRLLDAMARLQDYVWRRQLAAYFDRIASNAGGRLAVDGAATMAVGFADMADYTALTRRSSEAELRLVLESFESAATEVVAGHGGQVVKTIGDEVLFVAPDAPRGAEIALGLLERARTEAVLPPLRAGVGFGPVVSRLGDVYGQTVNIASRLTSVARADSVLVDEGMAAALDGDDAYHLRPLRPVSVRGYQHLRPWRLRRASAG